jgi:tRNA (guanine-N7-)-methyltransferase
MTALKHRPIQPGSVLLDESLAQAGRLDLRELFGNDRPVEMEIGAGKGTFLLARAQARPELNFLGLEWARAYCQYAADRFARAGLSNVRMLRADASAFVRDGLPNDSLLRLHIYFPDPWPKRRHLLRRLVQPAFVVQATRVLGVGGQLIVITDHLDYFGHIQRVLLDAPCLARIPMPRMADHDGELAGTNFERKYIAQGRAFYAMARLKYL